MFDRIAIIGSGAIGLYYGSRLAQHGHDVTFLMRSDANAAKQRGIIVDSVHGDLFLPAPQIAESAEEIGPVDLVIIAWKTTSNHLLKDVLPPLLHETTKVLTLQNGIGNAEKIAALVGQQRVIAGLCFVAINRTAPAKINHTGGGRIDLAALAGEMEFGKNEDDCLQALVELFSSSQVEAVRQPCMESAIWKKLLWNIPFNGLAISEGKNTQELLADPSIVVRIRALMKEVWSIAAARGFPIDESLIDWHIERTYKIGAYRPSSMIDWQEGREIEIEPIWGEPLRMGKECKLELPELQRLHEEISKRCISN
jgi:2-dehydropantoate 2-reductase